MAQSSHKIINLNKDFSTGKEIMFNKINQYNTQSYYIQIDGDVIWCFNDESPYFGACYDLKTGKKISDIAARGKKTNELESIKKVDILQDSVAFHTEDNIIKTFAKKDILNNIPIQKRKCSITKAPKGALISQAMKLANGSVLATIRPAVYEFEKAQKNNINSSSVILYNNKQTKPFKTIDYKSFNVGVAKEFETDANELVKWSYAQGELATNNRQAVFSLNDQFILYTLDLETGKIMNEKRYTEMKRDGGETSFTTKNDVHQYVQFIKADNQYITCMVKGFLDQEDVKNKQLSSAIFVFDWNLKPIKRFNLPKYEPSIYKYYILSNDGRSVYFIKSDFEQIKIYKGDLTI